ncbi:hypothetical protein [Flavivirga rizhaonensis]|uniref:DoxX family protein n=1 Tax=Flavivirga rizhaonensis TaxID=2559571 RepID=A0A4S1DRV3_9FLAO|nr:hypothetical protein [Flavivirga rizhaonensis]TGV00710.1 hypothetical protein EM932_18625 [Flavivirga rizhaonensis]
MELIKKIGFRLIFVYFITYVLLFITSPWLESILNGFSLHVLDWGNDIEFKSTGSGDRKFDFVRLWFNVLLTLIITSIWSLLDQKRETYDKLHYGFLVFIRFMLFVIMQLYGMAKVFKVQFTSHSYEKLIQPIGELSPMGLAWTFMGHSFMYNIFLGFAEVLGGLLLLSKRTTTLGSLIILGVMSNVLVMNLTYDIPVKLFSTHIILMSLILLMSDRKRLIDFFIRNRNVEKNELYTPLKKNKFRTFISVFKKGVGVLILVVVVAQCFLKIDVRGLLTDKSMLHGVWEVESFQKNKQLLPPLLTDATRWRYFIIDEKRKAVVKKMTDDLERFKMNVDVDKQQMMLSNENDSTLQVLSFKFQNKVRLKMQGIIYGDTLNILLNKKSDDDFKLISRKFQWITEKPYQY